MRVGQAEAVFLVLQQLAGLVRFFAAQVVQVHGTGIRHGIAEAGVVGLVLGRVGARFGLDLRLAIAQASTEVAQFGADGGGDLLGAFDVVDLGAVDGLIAHAEGEDTPVTGGTDGVGVVQLVQLVVAGGLGGFTGSVGGRNFQATQAGGLIGDDVVGLVGDAGQAVGAVVPAAIGLVAHLDDISHRGVHAAQQHGTEATRQAHVGIFPVGVVGIFQATVVGAGAVFQVEQGFQAGAQLFRANDADPGAAPDAVVDLQVALAGAAGFLVQAFHGNVDATSQLDAGLGLGKCGQCCRNGQCNKRFFHCQSPRFLDSIGTTVARRVTEIETPRAFRPVGS